MSPRTEKQFEEIREERRQQIMNVALELFANNGFDTTSISQIARKAKISKGLLYNYFSSKEDLVRAILDKGIDDLIAVFDPNKDGVLDIPEMEFFINESFNMLSGHRIFWKLYFAITFQPSVFKLIQKRIDELYKPMTRMMMEYFSGLDYKDPLTESIIFGALLDGISLNYVMQPELFPLARVKNELIDRYCTKKN
jgi:AcrR family transcriptional regulator